MCTYHPQQQKFKNKDWLPDLFVLHVYITPLQHHKNKNKTHFQNYQSYMCTYPLQQKNINTNDFFLNLKSSMYTYPLQRYKHKKITIAKLTRLICVHTLYNNNKNIQKDIIKTPSLTCVHTLYNNTIINTMSHFQNNHSYMFAYPLQQYKHKQK